MKNSEAYFYLALHIPFIYDFLVKSCTFVIKEITQNQSLLILHITL